MSEALTLSLLRTLHICMPEEPCRNETSYNSTDLFAKGIIVVDESGNLYKKPISAQLGGFIVMALGNSNDQWYNSFHKSWEKVANSTLEELLTEQVLHYFSTYGLESFGLQAHPYIPTEQLFINLDEKPALESFTVVRILSEEMCKKLATEYLISLKSINATTGTVATIETLLKFTEVAPESLSSFEVKCLAFDRLHLMPKDPTDWLRYVVYKTTGSPVLIKSPEVIRELSYTRFLDVYFEAIEAEKLATIFYRFKPLFLAMKHAHISEETKHKINVIRRLAKKYHKPMAATHTAQNLAKFASEGNWDAVAITVQKLNNRQLIKCLNWISASLAPQQQAESPEEVATVYNIRNSKVYVDMNKLANPKAYLHTLFEMLGNELVIRFKDKFAGKTFMIPSYIHYAAPVSEKQMMDRYPFGTSITTPSSGFCTAIHWNNLDVHSLYDNRVDLDYHLNSITASYGWNSSYRSSDREILFSGDMTDATRGAAEVYKVPGTIKDPMLVSVSKYHPMGAEVTFKFMLAAADKFKRSYAGCPISVKDALFTPVEITLGKNASDTTLGVFSDDKFYFYTGSLSSGRIPSQYNKLMPGIVINRLRNSMPLKNILIGGGAAVINEVEYNEMSAEEKQNVISLAPSDITVSTLFELID